MTQKPAIQLSRAACASVDLQVDGVPEWVHLLPAAQGTVFTHDGRGPYRVIDPAAIIAASLNADPRDEGGLIIDENHASDIAAPLGQPSPARGRIIDMEIRPDGIWGKAKWTAAGHALMADRAYRGISPVISYDAKTGAVHSILRAGLVNYPNLRGLTALNSEVQMDLTTMAKALGLAETATMDDILAAITELQKGGKGGEAEVTAMQASLMKIGAAVGVAGGDAAAILAAVTAKAAEPGTEQLVAMQAEVAKITTAHNTLVASHAELQTQIKRDKASAFVDAAIADARPGIKPLREHYIARHMQDAAAVEKEIAAIPAFGASRLQQRALQSEVADEKDLTSLNAEQQGRVLHDRAVAWQSEQKAKGIAVALFDAINHVKKEMTL